MQMAPRTLSDLEQAVRADPENAKLHHLLAAEYAQAGQPDRAKAEFFHAITLDPAAHVARFQLGLLFLTMGESTAAVRVWQPLESLPEDAALRHFALGLEALIHGDSHLCREMLAAGIAGNSANPPLNEDMCRILARLGTEAAPIRTDFSLYGTTRH
jgi:tetratricopeptide (TPR) repeat protein